MRFIQLYHRGWDMHDRLPPRIKVQAKDVDQPQAALIQELKERGMLDDTLVIWGGEFGRTIFCQGRLTDETYGRDHHPRAFTIWMAGGGVNSPWQKSRVAPRVARRAADKARRASIFEDM